MKKIMVLMLGMLLCLPGCGGGGTNPADTALTTDSETEIIAPGDRDTADESNGETLPPEPEEIDPIVFDEYLGYTESLPFKLEIANFKYGAELPYTRYNGGGGVDMSRFHARSFAYEAPVYSYRPNAIGQTNKYQANSTWSDPDSGDSCNYFTMLSGSTGTGEGTATADYRMYIPALQEAGHPINNYGLYPKDYENYLDLSDCDTLYIDMSSTSSLGQDVEYSIYWKNHNGAIRLLYTYNGKSGVRHEIKLDISGIPEDERGDIEFIRFEQKMKDISAGETITVRIFSIRAESATPQITQENVIGGMDVSSEYLGHVLYTKWGAYSATGFYDSSDQKIKIWYGAGTAERDSSDNIYYIECSDLSQGFSKPVRITMDDSTGYKLIDPTGKLKRHDEQIGYGGDPSVVKVDGVYYMYFSALENGLDDGKYTHWNKIYVATSTEAKTWTVQGVPLDCATGGSLGYGGGSPSVVYKDGEFWMYYYTQAPDYRYPNEPTGLVMKKSTDGINFGEAISIDSTMSTMDVKYIPSLRKWIGTYYAEEGQWVTGARAGVRIAFSDDGIHWTFDHSDNSMIAQNLDYPINHNPGLIGNELGHGYETMFVMYGANDLPMAENGYWFSAAQYDARQLEWTRIRIE